MHRVAVWTIAGLGLVASSVSATAQIRMPGGATPPDTRPSGGGGAGEIETMTVAGAEQFARGIGLQKVQTKVNDDKTTSVYGSIKGVDVEVSLGECNTTCDSSFEVFTYFGKQDSVDPKFMNAFNVDNQQKLVTLDNGELALMGSFSLVGGVTMRHLVESGKVYVSAIDDAMSFKPK